MARPTKPSVVHCVNPRDPRTSACGLWWWCNGGNPATDAPSVTCLMCKRARAFSPVAFSTPPDRKRTV